MSNVIDINDKLKHKQEQQMSMPEIKRKDSEIKQKIDKYLNEHPELKVTSRILFADDCELIHNNFSGDPYWFTVIDIAKKKTFNVCNQIGINMIEVQEHWVLRSVVVKIMGTFDLNPFIDPIVISSVDEVYKVLDSL